ncbi:hypothetical protein AMEX_G16589 [Astyanax mexicanus]|uniref:DUF393 domain-containing protein n=2 Tax=Astyanax mexicanus TaxID=7994 RepID=A0A8T2LHW6_ASTMX|nr:hypothetical protein AMEX_G16589 [Astyanax mexicanus]
MASVRVLTALRCNPGLRTAAAAGPLRLICSSAPQPVRVLYDGECPICVKEIEVLRFVQKNRTGKVEFVDISVPEYDGGRYRGVSYEVAMKEMTVIDENDEVHRGVPAFAVMYKAVGLGWLARLISLPLIRPLMDRAYDVFARNRLRWTGREECTTGQCDKRDKREPR